MAVAAAIELLAAVHAFAFGGFHLTWGLLRISSGEPMRPWVLGLLFAAVSLWLRDRALNGKTWQSLPRWCGPLSAVAAIGVAAAGIILSPSSAGASDPYGYVSQALRWMNGDLFVREPLAAFDPILAKAAAPLGYRLVGAETSVPIYSPGLPLLMAAAAQVAGVPAIYYVVPLCAGIAVWLTFMLGRHVSNLRAGLLAAFLVATSPILLLELFFPMSDLTAASLWLAAIVLALARHGMSSLGAGLAAAAAILTRPNLVFLAVPVAALAMGVPARRRPLLLFTIGVLPGCLAIAVLHTILYGSPLMSGYGALDTLFRWEWIGLNLSRFSRWLVQLHTPGILLACIAPLVAWREAAIRGTGNQKTVPIALVTAFWLSVVFSYASYEPYDGWQFLRFWLPAIPPLLVLSALVAVAIIDRLPVSTRAACFVMICGLGIGTYLSTADRLGVFFVPAEERRYRTIGEFLGGVLPAEAVVFAGLHSGSLRMYSGRQTLRWDQLRPEEFDRAVTVLIARGYAPYLLVEGDEESQFRNWFTPATALGRLDWAPTFEYPGHQHARVYALAAADRMPAVPTRAVPIR